MIAHAQKPDFVFRRNGRVHLNRPGPSVQSTTGSRGVRISGSNAGYTMFRGSVKSTGYPLHSPVFPSLPLPCVTVCHHISTGLYCTSCWLIRGMSANGEHNLKFCNPNVCCIPLSEATYQFVTVIPLFQNDTASHICVLKTMFLQ